ncbi:MAG: nickel pincer cofactor biosynthesis protein LarC [Methanoregula sp.]|nr:nickel pincer cofactor biosynthesis protein LarC [Methanoregula sp.]
MRILIFDPFHGAAGDMITAALLDCGADLPIVLRAMQAVVAEPKISTVTRAGIRAVKVDTRATPAHRTLADVLARLDGAAGVVPAPVLAMARKIFERINAAEESVHGAHVLFHEVGADDAIADVIGACTALHTLAVDGVVVLPIALGRGTATGSHGMFPIPAPATAAILKGTGLATLSGPDDGELCTPTGAALLAGFSTVAPKDLKTYTILASGYGAGSRDTPETPNVLRAMIIETITGKLPQDTVDILETNVDDVSGEVIAHTIALCMEAGARDASTIPIIMKKGRPGFLIRVICQNDRSAMLAELMARELGTLGIRCIPAVHRFIAERTIIEIEVSINGQIRYLPVKCGWMHGAIYTLKAEFDPARDWACELKIPVKDVILAIEDAGWKNVTNKHKDGAQ